MDGSQALDALYWKAEILQVFFWMRGEGLGTEVTAATVSTFVATDLQLVTERLAFLAGERYLEIIQGTEPEQFVLTELGMKYGGRSFHDEFADYKKRGHGECGDDCWCHDPDHVGEPCLHDSKGVHAH